MKDKKRFFACILTILLLINFLPLNVSAETYDSEKAVKIGYFAMDNFMEGGEDGSFKRGLTYELLCILLTDIDMGTVSHSVCCRYMLCSLCCWQ